MADPRDTQDLQTQFLDTIRKSQDAVIDGMRSWAETMQRLVPAAGQAAMPRSDQLPSAAEVVDSMFDFAAQLLDAQRQLAHAMLGATASVGEQVQQVQEEAGKATEEATKATEEATKATRPRRS